MYLTDRRARVALAAADLDPTPAGPACPTGALTSPTPTSSPAAISRALHDLRHSALTHAAEKNGANERIPVSTISFVLRTASTAGLAVGLFLGGSLIEVPAHASAQQSQTSCSGRRIGHVQIMATGSRKAMKAAYLHIYRSGSRVCAFTNTSAAAERFSKDMEVSLWACGRTADECRRAHPWGRNDPSPQAENSVKDVHTRTKSVTILAGDRCIQAWAMVGFTDWSSGVGYMGYGYSPISCPPR
ncbi:hypothetical protein [Microbispora hainanensis]|uniref:Uncharacterized protein n=1 Tax=Microbispora hainanensis TaxID=568844 RepID=A0A544YXH2_9ACTN|nr:hypothetical protein [Microbispora hainanensis]TQS21469.1 hypothetical protein FLX08_11620 [Microbispora hainanensis]